MSGFLSRFFSLFSSAPAPQAPVEKKQMIGDLAVVATPMRDASQFRVCGRIEKQVEGEILVRRFIRADLFSSESDALDTTFRKARQIIDQNGEGLFADGAKDRMV